MALLLILALAFPQPLDRALDLVPDDPPPRVGAEAWVIFDDTHEYEIASLRPDRAAPMASTTKLMTALLVAEQADLADTVIVSRRAEATGHKQIWLEAGDRWAVSELLEAAMVVSANDAAVALAEHVAGGHAAFVSLMNRRARELEMGDTSFANAHGLDARNHYTTPRDLLRLARAVMEEPVLARMAGQSEATIVDGEGVASIWESTNELVGEFDGMIGLKTGWTSGAGDVLVGVAQRGERRIYVVVMGSDDANRDVARLLDYAFTVFGPAERRLVPLMEDRHQAEWLRTVLPSDALARIVHLRGLALRSEAPWE